MNKVLSNSWTQFNGKSVLVTGGTGSFGKAFIERLLANSQPSRVVVLSRDELKQAEMASDFQTKKKNSSVLRFFIGDVRDEGRLNMAFANIEFVVHAAAIKHVPIAEYNPFECIKTNVQGAENVVRACLQNNVKKVIALSTDKAASPANLYGASKLASDKIFVAANNMAGLDSCRFSVVRYGNVVGSRGSVIPLFKKIIASGSTSLPITDKRMTRFWITLDQGTRFVMSCFDMMRGGEIFVPKIPSMRITDLASCMAPELDHRFIGVRPGEKLHETMITEDDARYTVELDDRFVIQPSITFWKSTKPKYKGKHVAEDFRYSSDTNKHWLSEEALRNMLSES